MLVVASDRYFHIGLCFDMHGNIPKDSILEFNLVKGLIKVNCFYLLII
jgi:hypothetical protein